jgi:hypothetical protein
VLTFAIGFVATMAGLLATLESDSARWRDPEFGVRLDRVKRWQAGHPDRPLVVAFGSSRTQMGLNPAAMEYPNEPGSPIVYNFGYRAGHPMGAWLQFTRVLDAGVKPAAVLIQLAPAEVMIEGPADQQFPHWAPRFSLADIRRLEPFTKKREVFEEGWRKSRKKFWATYREAIMSEFLPQWQPQLARYNFTWEWTDRYGFAPHPFAEVPDDIRARVQETVRREQNFAFTGFTWTKTTHNIFRTWVGRCKAEGIPVAFFWIPESPNMRGWYSAVSRKSIADYERRLERDFGVPVFPAATHLAETDFADGYHLLRGGAAKYSRWLAETHLDPWLAAQGVTRH